jgi:hypothetical protein
VRLPSGSSNAAAVRCGKKSDCMLILIQPWTLEKIPGGLKVCDANGQSLAYVYSREKVEDARTADVLTEDEARRIASNIAKLPVSLGKWNTE